MDSKTLTPIPPPWLDLPTPLVEDIIERLPLSDYVRFAAVCSTWNRLQSHHRANSGRLPLPLPLLILSDSRGPRQRIPCFSPFELKFYQLHPLPSHPSAVLASQSSWLLIHEKTLPVTSNITLLSLFNPISGSLIQLPSVPVPLKHVPHLPFMGSLSGPPTNPNCFVMLINQDEIFLYRVGGSGWTKLRLPNPALSAVFSKGKFYCSCDEFLVMVDTRSSKLVLDSFKMDARDLPEEEALNDLVEVNGEIVLVRVRFEGDENKKRIAGVDVFRADFVNEMWVRMESLGDWVVILGDNNSVAVLGDDVGVNRGDLVYFVNPYRGSSWCGGKRWTLWVVLDLRTGEIKDGTLPEEKWKDDYGVFRKKQRLRRIMPNGA